MLDTVTLEINVGGVYENYFTLCLRRVDKNLGVEFSVGGFGVRVDIVRALWFVQSVGSLVLLPHSVDDEHD